MATGNRNQTLFHFFKKSNLTESVKDSSTSRPVSESDSTNDGVISVDCKSDDVEVSESREHGCDSEEKPAKKRKYSFNNEWRTNRPWLVVNEKQEMLCKWCIDTGKKNSFTCGNNNFRTSTLDRHVDLPAHKRAIQDMKLGEKLKVQNANAFCKKSDSVTKAMGLAYYMAKENIASVKFCSMLDFMDFSGIDVGSMRVGDNATYTSRATVDEFQECIAEVIETGLLKEVSHSPYISLLTDESTDISNSKKMVIYARIINPDTFIASTHFLGNLTIEGSSCTAEVLFSKMVGFLEEKKIPVEKVVGFGSDGASVMTGTRSGVATRFRERNPHLINIHCMVHRFNLCTSQASRSIKYLKGTFEVTFKDLYYYFDKSANRVAELKEMQKPLDSPQLKVREVHEIRWLAFYDALYAIYHSWKPLVNYFTKNNKTKVCQDLLCRIIDYRFVAFLHVMMDIIPHLAQLSMLLQKSDLDIAAVTPALNNTQAILKQADAGKSYYQRILDEKLVFEKIGDRTKTKFSGVELSVHRSTMKKAKEDVSKIRNDFVTNLQSQMKARFPKDSTTVATAFDVLGLRNLTFLSTDELDAYGEEKIGILCRHFGEEKQCGEVRSPAMVNSQLVISEWALAKAIIKKEMYPRDRMAVLWSVVLQHHADTLPNVLKLAAIAMVMPYQTADCERGFSEQNRLKTPLRNRLEETTMNQLMMINIEGPPLRVFNFGKALEKWKGKKDRRLFKK